MKFLERIHLLYLPFEEGFYTCALLIDAHVWSERAQLSTATCLERKVSEDIVLNMQASHSPDRQSQVQQQGARPVGALSRHTQPLQPLQKSQRQRKVWWPPHLRSELYSQRGME